VSTTNTGTPDVAGVGLHQAVLDSSVRQPKVRAHHVGGSPFSSMHGEVPSPVLQARGRAAMGKAMAGIPKIAELALETTRWTGFSDEFRKLAGTVEVAHNFHPVVVQPPQAKRAKFPFTGFIDFQGLKIDVENKKGEYRRGTDRDGHEWKCLMHAHYGEIRDTEGTDGDKLDVYVGPNHDSSLVVVVRQHKPDTGAFDEDKVMVGFDSVEEAIGAYKKQYDKPGFYKDGDYKAMPIGEFWRWVHDRGNHGKKVASMSNDGVLSKMAADLPDLVRPTITPHVREFALHPNLQKGLAGAGVLGGLVGSVGYVRHAKKKELETGKPSILRHAIVGGGAGALVGAGVGAHTAHTVRGPMLAMREQARPSVEHVMKIVNDLKQQGKSAAEIRSVLSRPGIAEHVRVARIGAEMHNLAGKITLGKGALLGAGVLGVAGAVGSGIAAHANRDVLAKDIAKRQAEAGHAKEGAELPGVGDEGERPRVAGMKQPRLATPRLNPDQGKHIPTNPFRGNWKKLGSGESVLHSLESHVNAIPAKYKHGLLGAGVLATGAATLKGTADQAVNPRPEGVGLGAGARTVQKALSAGLSRAGSGPEYQP